jgi:hypothetical protein
MWTTGALDGLVRPDGCVRARSWFPVQPRPDALRYGIASLGVDLVGAGGGIFSPYLTYSRSHGRGIDFPKFFGTEVGFGIALLP